MEEKILLESEYSAEGLFDFLRDVEYAIETGLKDVPVDEYGFFSGSVKITLTYIP